MDIFFLFLSLIFAELPLPRMAMPPLVIEQENIPPNAPPNSPTGEPTFEFINMDEE